jgi:hypothetical protein
VSHSPENPSGPPLDPPLELPNEVVVKAQVAIPLLDEVVPFPVEPLELELLLDDTEPLLLDEVPVPVEPELLLPLDEPLPELDPEGRWQ